MEFDNASIELDLGQKKKKPKKKTDINKPKCEIHSADLLDESQRDHDVEHPDPSSDIGYTYDELLNRVFKNNPNMDTTIATSRTKFVMRPPQVLRVGTKKTSFANFTEICKTLHRQPNHLLEFLLAELSTSGSVDGDSQLIIKGRFQSKQIENVLRRYIKEYVICKTCRSPETILQKDTRLLFLQCESCGSRCSVTSSAKNS